MMWIKKLYRKCKDSIILHKNYKRYKLFTPEAYWKREEADDKVFYECSRCRHRMLKPNTKSALTSCPECHSRMFVNRFNPIG